MGLYWGICVKQIYIYNLTMYWKTEYNYFSSVLFLSSQKKSILLSAHIGQCSDWSNEALYFPMKFITWLFQMSVSSAAISNF